MFSFWCTFRCSQQPEADMTSPSKPQRQVTFLKPAADTNLDRKASIVDETSGITRTQMKGEIPLFFT